MPGQSAEVAALVELLRSRPPRLGCTRLVCVDGPAGSGKTTLASGVEAALAGVGSRATTLHLDDMYDGWSGLRPELERRLFAQVLHPLSKGDVARWQRYDWHTERFDRWADLAPPEVLVLEGCGSGAEAYAPYRSLLVWVEAPVEVRLRRAVERDGAAVLSHWYAWMDAEARHYELNATRACADVRLEG